MIQIPFTNEPNQSLTVSVPLADRNIVVDLFLYWNNISNYWELNIADGTTTESLITSLPMIRALPPAANLLEPFTYLNIGEAYVVPLSSESPENPNTESWGKDFAFVWG